MTEERRRLLSASVTLHGELSLGAAAEVVRGGCAAVGLRPRREVAVPGGVDVEATQAGGRWRVLLHALPQQVCFHLRGDADAVTIDAVFRLHAWYARLLTGLALAPLAAAAVALWVGARPALRNSPGGHAVLAVLLAVLLLLGRFPRLLAPLGGGLPVARMWQRMQHHAKSKDARLELVGAGASDRYRTALLAFAVGFAAYASAWLVVGVVVSTNLTPVKLAVLTVLWCLALCFPLCLATILRRRGSELRSEAVLPGLVTSVAMLLLLLPPVLALAFQADLALLLATARAAPRPVLRVAAMALVISPVLVAALGAVLVAYGVRTAWRGFAGNLERLASPHRVGVNRQAVADGVALRRLRRVFVALATLQTLLLLVGSAVVAGSLAPAVRAVALREPASGSLVALTTRLTVLALGTPAGARPVSFAVALAWCLLATVVAAAWLLSLGDLVVTRWRLRRKLRRGATAMAEAHPELTSWVAELTRRAGLPSLHLCLTESGRLEAEAVRFGAGRGERFLRLSRGALETLAPATLRAVLAHEVAHHACGHAVVFQAASWLGRLSFAGDGAAVALLNSFGYEAEADARAVTALGTPPQDLIQALWQLRAVGFADALRRREAAGLPFLALKQGPPSWSSALPFFRRQYFAPLSHHYWHPATEERVTALRRLADPGRPPEEETP